jgi:hypothetical protein
MCLAGNGIYIEHKQVVRAVHGGVQRRIATPVNLRAAVTNIPFFQRVTFRRIP